ncbi:hypothetical protein K2X30_01855 [bacterium]|nr:hypothetical protein [bacterium]
MNDLKRAGLIIILGVLAGCGSENPPNPTQDPNRDSYPGVEQSENDSPPSVTPSPEPSKKPSTVLADNIDFETKYVNTDPYCYINLSRRTHTKKCSDELVRYLSTSGQMDSRYPPPVKMDGCVLAQVDFLERRLAKSKLLYPLRRQNERFKMVYEVKYNRFQEPDKVKLELMVGPRVLQRIIQLAKVTITYNPNALSPGRTTPDSLDLAMGNGHIGQEKTFSCPIFSDAEIKSLVEKSLRKLN